MANQYRNVIANSAALPENTVVVYVSGGQVQWATRGPGRKINLIIVDGDKSDCPELDEPDFRVWDERCETGVFFRDGIGSALYDFHHQARQ